MNKNQFLIDLSASGRTKVGKVPFLEQSVPQKVFTAIREIESEVNNGGFTQYFANSSAESAEFVGEALKVIGAAQTAKICEQAISSAYPNGLPENPREIAAVARNFSDEVNGKLSGFDEEFVAYPHDLTDLLFSYVARFPDEFGAVPNDL